MLGAYKRLHGWDAWDHAKSIGGTLSVYGHQSYDMVEQAGGSYTWQEVWHESQGGITPQEATEVLVEAPQLLWIDVPQEVCA